MDSGGSGRQWFAVNARPHAERVAFANLARQEFLPFLPTLRKTIRHARRFRTVLSPLFPGYLFVALDLSRDRWRSVNGTLGVVSLVMSGGSPVAVPRGVVEHFIAASSEGGLIRLDGQLREGQRVRLLSGPLAQRLGILERLDDRGRVRVLLDMMGMRIPVMAKSDQLVPA